MNAALLRSILLAAPVLIPSAAVSAASGEPPQAPRAASASPAAAPATPELLERTQRELAAIPPGSPETARLAARADQIRRSLVQASPEDDRAPTWLVDSAAYALAQAGDGGDDLSVLFGVPTPAQRLRVHQLATAAMELLRTADAAAARAAQRLEAVVVDRSLPPDAARARAAQADAALSRIIDVEQSQRIPFLQATAELLLSAAAIGDPSAPLARSALLRLRALPETPGPAGAPTRVLIGQALLLDAGDDRSGDARRAAAAQFESALATGPALAPQTALAATLGLIRCGREPGALTPADPPAPPVPPAALARFAPEAAAAAQLDAARRDLSQRARRVAAACESLLANIADASPADRLLIYEKIALAVPDDLPPDTLPAEAALAEAITLARTAPPGDRPSLLHAAGLLASCAARADAPPRVRADARWERAVLLSRVGTPAQQADALAQVIRLDRDSPNALAAAGRLLALPGATTDPALAPLALDAATLLSEHQPTDASHAALIALSIPRIRRAENLAAFDTAAATLSRLPPSDQRTALQRALSEALAQAIADVRAALKADAPEGPSADPAGWTALVPWARRARDWTAAHDPTRAGAAQFALAEALAYSADAAAPAAIDIALALPQAAPGSADWLRLRFALAAALRSSGDQSGAFAVLRDLAQRLDISGSDAAPALPHRPPAFWRAWTEMLEILAALNQSGARSDDIRAQIKRLELIDPALGGEPFATRIRAVRTAVGP